MHEQSVRDEATRLKHAHALVGWDFDIKDEHPTIEECAGYTDFEQRRIEVYRELWPTREENMIEVVRHEFAHALVGHGRHTPEWWDQLVSLGGSGAWLNDDGSPAPWSWTREKTQLD